MMTNNENKMSARDLALFVMANVAYIAAAVHKVARRYGAEFTDTEIEDIVSETSYRVVRTGLLAPEAEDKNNRRARSYLGTVAANLAKDMLRARKDEQEINGTDAKDDEDGGPVPATLADGGPDPEEILAAKETLARLNAAAEDTLTGVDLAIWRAMMAQGGPNENDFDMQGFADAHGMTLNTVKIRKCRALAAVREAFDSDNY